MSTIGIGRALTFFLIVVSGSADAMMIRGEEGIRWRFRTEGRTWQQFIAVAPEGTIYTADGRATYAINPDGTLRWESVEASGDSFGGRPISIGADGTIYTGVGFSDGQYIAVVALNPDGSVRWRFAPDNSDDLIIGPNVGPDGNVYAVQETTFGGIGAFALDPDGNLLWSNPGDSPLSAANLTTTSNVVFGEDRLHFGIVRLRSGGNPVIYTFDLDGNQLWTSRDLNVHTTDFPVVDPFNRVIATWGQTGIRAISPDGDEEWFRLHPNGANLTKRPAIDRSGIIYTGDWLGVELWALNADGSTRYVRPRVASDSLTSMALSPDGSLLVVTGGLENSDAWYVRGHDPADGSIIWQVDFLPEDGVGQLVSSFDPVFSADGSTVYITTQFAGDTHNHGYVYAIDTGLSRGVAAELVDLRILDGQLIAGGLPELSRSDDRRLETEARVTGEVHQPHLLRLRIDADTDVQSASGLSIVVEGRITDVEAQTTLSLRDWVNGRFVEIDQFSMTMNEESHETIVPQPADYIRAADGLIRLEIKQIVFFPFTLNGFHTFLDQVEMVVR